MQCVPEVHRDNAQDQERVNVIRMLLAAFEHAQRPWGNRLSTRLTLMGTTSSLIAARH
ncbi:MAG: hypothetical protein M3R47_12660 [Chloroflexota bacterium]|nr:hypothetical protein [Chloroflexota bacterium]